MFKSFFEQISGDYTYQVLKDSEKENEKYYSVEITFSELGSMKLALDSLFGTIPSRDKCVVSLSLDHLSPLEISNMEEYEDFNERVSEDFLEVADEESTFKLVLRINKVVMDNMLSFYSLPLLKSFLLSKNVSNGLSFFGELLAKHNFIHIIVLDNDIKGENLISTSSISISWNVKDNHLPKFPSLKRSKIIHKQRSVSTIVNDSNNWLLPNDLMIEGRTFEDEDIEEYLNNLSFALSLGFIFDIVDITDDNLRYKINGYKTIEGSIDFPITRIFNKDQLYYIYDWVYSEGNVSDKVGLARNIISLNLTHTNSENFSEFYLSDSTYGSIQSGYEIYLKENVGKYIEVKNKVSEFMINKSIESSNLIRDFTNSLKNNNYLFVSFILSFIIYKSFKPTITAIFSREIVIISLCILLISVLYLLLNVWTINEDKKRFESQYDRLKRMYSDLLNEEDISSIFLQGEQQEDMDYIKKKRNLYVWVWGLEILFLFFLVMILAEYNSVFDITGWLTSLFN